MYHMKCDRKQFTNLQFELTAQGNCSITAFKTHSFLRQLSSVFTHLLLEKLFFVVFIVVGDYMGSLIVVIVVVANRKIISTHTLLYSSQIDTYLWWANCKSQLTMWQLKPKFPTSFMSVKFYRKPHLFLVSLPFCQQPLLVLFMSQGTLRKSKRINQLKKILLMSIPARMKNSIDSLV